MENGPKPRYIEAGLAGLSGYACYYYVFIAAIIKELNPTLVFFGFIVTLFITFAFLNRLFFANIFFITSVFIYLITETSFRAWVKGVLNVMGIYY